MATAWATGARATVVSYAPVVRVPDAVDTPVFPLFEPGRCFQVGKARGHQRRRRAVVLMLSPSQNRNGTIQLYNFLLVSELKIHTSTRGTERSLPLFFKKKNGCHFFWEEGVISLGHSQCKTLSQSLRQLIMYYLWYFADVAAYLLKEKDRKNKTTSLI